MTSLPVPLPEGFTTHVKEGDAVTVGQVIASKNASSEEIINIPKALSITIRKAKKTLLKIPGEKVEKGDVIAVKKSLFGANTLLRSSAAGTIIRYERDSGNLVIKIDQVTITPFEIISPVDGRVLVCDNKEIVIGTEKHVLIGGKGVGDRGQGEVFVLESDDPYHLNVGAIDKIVVGGKLTREMLLKGIGIGVVGLVGSSIADDDIQYLIEKKFKIPVIEVDESSLQKLREWRDRKAFVNPETKSIIFLQV